jgi:hypothetical protein
MNNEISCDVKCKYCNADLNYRVLYTLGGGPIKMGYMKCPGCLFLDKEERLVAAPAFEKGTQYSLCKKEAQIGDYKYCMLQFGFYVSENSNCPNEIEQDIDSVYINPVSLMPLSPYISHKTKLEKLGISYDDEIKKLAEEKKAEEDLRIHANLFQYQRKIPLDFD